MSDAIQNCAQIQVAGSVTTPQTINLQPALGSAERAALTAFHSLTKTDHTGSISAKGKPTCWNEFEEANELILRVLANLDKDEKHHEEALNGIEQFVCQYEQTTS